MAPEFGTGIPGGGRFLEGQGVNNQKYYTKDNSKNCELRRLYAEAQGFFAPELFFIGIKIGVYIFEVPVLTYLVYIDFFAINVQVLNETIIFYDTIC